MRDWLNIIELEQEVSQVEEDLEKNIQGLNQDIEATEEDLRQDMTDLRNKVYDVLIAVELTGKEKEVLDILLAREWVSTKEVAEELGTSTSNARTVINRLKKAEGINLEETKQGKNNAKAYKLPDQVKEKILNI